MFKAVVFDIDGTLTRDISWVRLTNEIGGSIEFNDEVIRSWEKDEISYHEAKQRLIENWTRAGKGLKKEFVSILKSIPLRGDAKEIVDYLKGKGYLITMITGSFDLYAEIIGEQLGIKNWFAITHLSWDIDGKLIDVETVKDTVAKDRKIDYFKEYCRKNNLTFKECVPVGDSANDIELFKLTGNGVAVRTEFEAVELEKVAWNKVKHLTELKELL